MIYLANPRYVAGGVLIDIVTPPPPVNYQGWAIRNIRFSDRESPFPGPYNPAQFPFFAEILKALGPDDPCRFVTFAKSAQLGGTILATIFVLGSMDLAPTNFLYVHPTEDNARRWSKMKLAPLMRSTTAMQRIFSSKSRDGADSVLYKERIDNRGAIQVSGANSPASLSQVTMPRQVQDDLAKWEINAAGDPEKQADSRSRAIEFAKIFKISTPLVEPGCRITRNFKAGTQEHYYVPCPHCDFEQTLEWENFAASIDEEAPEKAHFTCTDCGCAIFEHQRADMVRKGRWKAHNPKAAREHRSFYLWSAYSPLQSFERIAREWLSAMGDPAAEQVFWNDTVGRAYQTLGEAPPWEEIRKRADAIGHRRGIVPEGGLLVTIGVDCQDTFVAWQAIAWSRDGRRFVIDHGTIDGHISEETAQKGLDELLKATWRNAAGRMIGSDLLAIDGNAYTEDVWSWSKKHPVSRVIMVRGVPSEAAPLLVRVKRERKKGKLLKYSNRFYNFATSVLKMSLYRNLAKSDPLQRGFIGIPAGLEDPYFQELTAERRTPKVRKDGFTVYEWIKDRSQPNEVLDTMLQAEAAAIKYGIRQLADARWDRIEAERMEPLPQSQMDLEDLMAMPVIAPASKPKPPSPPRQKSTVSQLASLHNRG